MFVWARCPFYCSLPRNLLYLNSPKKTLLSFLVRVVWVLRHTRPPKFHLFHLYKSNNNWSKPLGKQTLWGKSWGIVFIDVFCKANLCVWILSSSLLLVNSNEGQVFRGVNERERWTRADLASACRHDKLHSEQADTPLKYVWVISQRWVGARERGRERSILFIELHKTALRD